MESECEDRRIVKLRCYNLLNRCWTDKLWFMGIPKLSRSSCFVCRSQRNIANGEMFYWSNQLWNFKEENETPLAYYKSNVWIIEWSIQNMDFPLGMFFFALFRSDQHFSAYIHQSIVVTIIIAANLRFTTYNTYKTCSYLNLCARHRFANYKIYIPTSPTTQVGRVALMMTQVWLLLLLLSVRTTINCSNNNSANNHFHRLIWGGECLQPRVCR